MTQNIVRKWLDEYGNYMAPKAYRAWSCVAEMANDETVYEAMNDLDGFDSATAVAKRFAKNMGIKDAE